MAKIMVHPQPGALSALLQERKMSKMDAHQITHVVRKTLLKIDRGELVKLETLQQVANRLRVSVDELRVPEPENTEAASAFEPNTVMLRKLDAERLSTRLKDATRTRWELNTFIPRSETRELLARFEEAVNKLHLHIHGHRHEQDAEEGTLRYKLQEMSMAEDIAILMGKLAEHGYSVFGADYLFWECEYDSGEYQGDQYGRPNYHYQSLRTVVLSIEPVNSSPHRIGVPIGEEPPKYASADSPYAIYVNCRRLKTERELEIEKDLGDLAS